MATVMIVDEATVMRRRLRDILEPAYKVVAEASNGIEALELYEKMKPDFVTLDITMPQLNGLAVIQNLLARDPQGRVIIVSAVGQRQVVYRALAQGARDFFVKPFEPERVSRAIGPCSLGFLAPVACCARACFAGIHLGRIRVRTYLR